MELQFSMWLLVSPLVIVFCLLFSLPCICWIFRKIVTLVTKNSDYGRLLSYSDSIYLDNDHVNVPPKATIVSTLTLDSVISYSTLFNIFKENVLEATLPGKPAQKRYKELKQFITKKWGFNIWKQDNNFRLEEHLSEVIFPDDKTLNLTEIHEWLLNKPYPHNKSPWEVILYRNKSDAKCCIVALRMIHAMGDGRSIVKLLVECLAGKKLITTPPKEMPTSKCDELLFKLLFFFRFWMWYVSSAKKMLPYAKHPWRTSTDSEDTPLAVRFTPEIKMSSIKNIGKNLKVLPSSVFVSVVAGACGKYNPQWNKILFGFMQPKSGHPDVLTNHAHIAVMEVPTGGINAADRTRKCSKVIQEMKRKQEVRYSNAILECNGSFWSWLQQILTLNRHIPAGFTNIAGELGEIRIGEGHLVTEHVMSVGTIRGCSGVSFCVFSYRDTVRISVIAKANAIDSKTLDEICSSISDELNVLTAENHL